MLTGWEIDIVDLDKLDSSKLNQVQQQEVAQKLKGDKPAKRSEKAVEMPVAAEDIKDLPGMSDDIASKLEAAGFVKSIQLMGLNAAAMTAIEGLTQEEAELVENALKGDKKKASKEEKEVKEEKEEKEVKTQDQDDKEPETQEPVDEQASEPEEESVEADEQQEDDEQAK